MQRAVNIPDASQDDEIDLFAIFSVLWRGKFWIGLAATIGFFIGGWYAFRVAEPIYPATATLKMETSQENIVDIQSVVADSILSGGWGDESQINTEMEVIQSRNMIAKLVAKLNLLEDPNYNSYLAEELAEMEPDESWLPQINIRGMIRSIFVSNDDEEGGDDEPISEAEVLNKVIDNALDVFRVSNISETYIFEIGADTDNPAESVRMANALADIYIQDAVDEKFEVTEKASKWLSQKAAELKVELESSEVRIKEFNDGTQFVSPENLALLTRQLKDMRQRITDLQETHDATRAKVQSIELLAGSNDYTSIADVAGDSRLTRLADMISNNQVTPDAFQTRLDQVMAQAKTDMARLTQQMSALSNSENTFKLQVEEQSDDLVQLQQLRREAEANSLLYESFLSRLKEITVQQGLLSPTARLLSPATPQRASAPRKASIMMMALILGGLAGVGAMLLRELMNNTFRSPEVLESFTAHNVLGTLPQIKANTRRKVLNYAATNPTSNFAEAVRNLRTSILLSDIDNPPQVIMTTSSTPAEGKTTVSLTLAQNMAGLGKRVLVLEGDIRKRVFAEYFDIEKSVGFIAVMTGEATLQDAVIRPEGMGVDILLGERSTANAADIFSSQKFIDLLKMLRDEYDYIIIDTPPVLAVPDARVIGQHADSIIYSVRWDKTSKTEVKTGLSMFGSVGLEVDGLVMTMLDLKKIRQYGYAGGYGYAYGYGDSYHSN
ncbi:protein-tyrosine kinase [Amylibacter ulvae]|uniref:non-specific protein-tyrosine kinase n=1 Tax=Paramylibacter ulvae TaxID=1651968 RepID=A0ABQ3D753_9RHOB|nr:polysaccharide biosynthesis tyrosine autokinase [Amylibacter ulvae]GHA58882.1 protein-tyrosine kinase [Amylibacter ulvae]